MFKNIAVELKYDELFEKTCQTPKPESDIIWCHDQPAGSFGN